MNEKNASVRMNDEIHWLPSAFVQKDNYSRPTYIDVQIIKSISKLNIIFVLDQCGFN